MTESPAYSEWHARLHEAAAHGQLVKLTLAKPTAAANDLKSVDIRPILVKRQAKLSFTYHHRTRDVVKNYTTEESLAMLRELLPARFHEARLCTTIADHRLRHAAQGWQLDSLPPSQKTPPDMAHDRPKQRLIEAADKPYLHALGITDRQGKVYSTAQDKFRQINKYIEILDGLIAPLPPRELLRIVDMGAGKGYLTFALYDHLTHQRKMQVEVVGVEFRAELVAQCNRIAQTAGFRGLRFVEGSIAAYDCTGADVVIALHACDTATDDAIAKAIHAEASLIVVAPCCHKQIRRAMSVHADEHPLGFLLQHGTYVERMAEMVTDGMRAQLLALAGYRTKLFEFISDVHTPKNVMIVGTRQPEPLTDAARGRIEATLAAARTQFGIDYHQLERLLARR